MPCGGSTQVFAFAALSSSSQLALAACMTTTSLLDFAAVSPAFNVFLHAHSKEIVLAALRKQYGYIPDYDTWGLSPLYTGPHASLPPIHDTPRAILRAPACRRHRRVSRDINDLLLELPTLQWLLDEELLSEHGKSLFALLPNSPHASAIYGAGIRGLLRYWQRYTTLLDDGTTRADLHRCMQDWLQERYTSWGINEMVFVTDALSSSIDALLPSLSSDAKKREQLLGSLLCTMEVLRLGVDVRPPPSEEVVLQKLVNQGVIEFLSSGWWKVTDTSHAYWFIEPAMHVILSRASKAEHEAVSACLAGRVQIQGACGELQEDGRESSGSPAGTATPRGMKLIMMAGAVARGARTKSIETGSGRPDRAGLVERGAGWGWDVGCLNRWYGSNN